MAPPALGSERPKQRSVTGDDTIERQIHDGDLEAMRIGMTPSERPWCRVPVSVLEERLGRSPLKELSAAERLQAACASNGDVVDAGHPLGQEATTEGASGGEAVPAPSSDGRPPVFSL